MLRHSLRILSMVAALIFLLEICSAVAHYYLRIKIDSRFAILSIARHILGPQFARPKPSISTPGADFPAYTWNPQLHHPLDTFLLANPLHARIEYCWKDENSEKAKIIRQSDHLGFRNKTGTQREFDAVLLGDSYGEGACVEEADTIAGVLSGAGIGTYNMSRAGSGPLFQLALLREYGPQIKAATVLWLVFTGNDIQNLREEKTTALARYLDPRFSQRLYENREGNDRKLKQFLLQRLSDHQERLDAGRPLPEAGPYGETLDLLDAQKYESKLLAEVAGLIVSEANSQQKRLAIILLHGHPDYNLEIQTVVQRTLSSFASTHAVPMMVFDLAEMRRQDHLPNHLDTIGYRFLGKRMAAWLRNEGLAAKDVGSQSRARLKIGSTAQ